jgi:hypothetical protein
MTTRLNAADRGKLAAILGRLGSDHAGERDAAALTATRFIGSKGMTWADVLAGSMTLEEALADYVMERMQARAVREAKREATKNDPAVKRRRQRRRALNTWRETAGTLRWTEYSRIMTEEERSTFEACVSRLTSAPRKSADDAIALGTLYSVLLTRKRQERAAA